MIGRYSERQALRDVLKTGRSEMVAVTGRRRVGKTYLIEQTYAKEIVFHLIGEKEGSLESQLQNFTNKLNEYSNSRYPKKSPKSWNDAFVELKKFLKRKRKRKTPFVIFFDELPWLASRKSGFLGALGYFWNDWAAKNNVIIVICGSAASWMIEKVINHKGGLHNRVTKIIHLEPFSLFETKKLLQSNGVRLDHYQITQLYMAMGGIPHYLMAVKSGESAVQAIDRICFTQTGLLANEFTNLYSALFNQPEKHIKVIRALASKWKGLTRREIVAKSGLTNGGGLSHVLEELTLSSFITAYAPYGKLKRDTLYRLTDEFSLFYIHFIEKTNKKVSWARLSQSTKSKSWYGYAFENLCLKHISQLKKELGISGVNTVQSSFTHAGNEMYDGLQVDLVIDRPDQTLHLCEMKYYNADIVIDKRYAKHIRDRQGAFQGLTKTKKHIFNTLVTTHGLSHNQHSIGLIDNVVTLDSLFDE